MNYQTLINKMNDLNTLPGTHREIIGYSLFGQEMPCFHVGNYTGKQIIVECAMHAREYITCLLGIELVKYLSSLPLNGGVYIIPLMNPDGVQLVLDGIDAISCTKLKEFLLSVNDNDSDFSLWKANGNCVDLNVNFNADWGEGAQNVRCIAPANFIGYYPDSERENQNLLKFVKRIYPALNLSYHSKGEVIYYGFNLQGAALERDYLFAQSIAEDTGYSIIKTENSTGGFSDWVTQKLHVPSFTVEVGNDELPHPLTEEQLPIIFEQNKDVIPHLLDMLSY